MLPRKYNPNSREPEWRDQWQRHGTYHYRPDSDAPLFAIDTPPPTVSGQLHLGHVYSYSQTDFLARYRRMRGDNVYYPMGFDDNGLPTERLVERQEGIRPEDVGRQKFIEVCLATSEKAEAEYQALWQRLGLSIDWRYTYRTIDEDARRLAQASFLDLLGRGLAYRQQAPALWCPTCQTAIAQADVADLYRLSEYVIIPFALADGGMVPIATTRPELLAACVAVFVHPEDARFAHLVGQMARTPLYDRPVPILADPAADPAKGSGAVMCCTFGDSTDLAWWRTHELPLIEAVGRDGRMTAAAGDLAGLTVPAARARIKELLAEAGLLLKREPTEQTVAAHDRCDTPIEFIQTAQWFITVLDHKERLLAAADELEWRPSHMKARYQQWVSNLNWDWCISRQRYFGVPLPVWYCDGCGAIQTADLADLPIDPTVSQRPGPCARCGNTTFTGDADVMDTWATSSLTPQIAANLRLPGVAIDAAADYLPFGLRPQAHEIIRTWTFYTVLQSLYHFDRLPWRTVALSGWGLAPEGEGKISKSRTSDVVGPLEMIERYSADAVRYWAASTGLGKDSRISEAKIQAGARLVTKLWNVARFAQRFLPLAEGLADPSGSPTRRVGQPVGLTLGDRWLLARLARLIERTTALMEAYDYAAAKSEMELFFWHDLADNYLEMAKQRLYEQADGAAAWTLRMALQSIIKLFAPFLPFITEQIYQGLFAESDQDSVHRAQWPALAPGWLDETAERQGEALLAIAAAVRRYKSEQSLALGSELGTLLLAGPAEYEGLTDDGVADLLSITRAGAIEWCESLPAGSPIATLDNGLQIGLASLVER